VSLQRSYTLLAPFYDFVVSPLVARARAQSLSALHSAEPADVLLDGVGTGLDLPLLDARHRYTALDITRAMLDRAVRRALAPRERGERRDEGKLALDLAWIQGDSEALPLADAAFDCVVLHLIVAVVPHPERALAEAARVTRAGGTLLVIDKFLAPGAAAPLRRLLNPLASRIASRTDVVFEDVLARVPTLRVRSDEAAAAGGWFRRITLTKL